MKRVTTRPRYEFYLFQRGEMAAPQAECSKFHARHILLARGEGIVHKCFQREYDVLKTLGVPEKVAEQLVESE